MKKWFIGIVVVVCLVAGWQTHSIYKAAVNDVQADEKSISQGKRRF